MADRWTRFGTAAASALRAFETAMLGSCDEFAAGDVPMQSDAAVNRPDGSSAAQ